MLTGPGCPKCAVNAAGPSSMREAGVAFMNPALRTRTSQTEQRLKILLAERIRLHHGVNAVRIARTFFGRQEVWPDILVPQLRIAVEYDDPGRSRRAHMGLKEASDLEKDDALREVGWEVVRIRAGGLDGVRAAQRGLLRAHARGRRRGGRVHAPDPRRRRGGRPRRAASGGLLNVVAESMHAC